MKKLLFAFLLFLTTEAHAQFAPGYAPSRARAPEEESSQSVLFKNPTRQQQEEPAAPVNIEKPTPYKGSIRILARVNGDIITTEDINNRVRAFCMTTGIPYNQQTKLLIINKVMQNTIDEKLKNQEAAQNQINISSRELENSVNVFCANNKISREQLNKMLEKFGVSEEVFKEQLKTDLSWIRVVQRNTMRDPITQPEIAEAMKVAERDMSKPKFLLLEIVIPSKEAGDISELRARLQQDPRFELYAAQFSQSPSSASGGKLGWVTEGQLDSVLENEIKKLSAGEISTPILHNGNYYIYKVEKKFNPQTDTLPLPTEKEIANLLQTQKNERFAEEKMQQLRQSAIIELKE